MRMRWLGCLTTALLLLPAPTLRAGDKPAEAPAVVLRVRSVDALLQNAKLLAKVLGEEAAGKSIEGLLKAKIGEKGFEGIDTNRPLGAYIRFGKEIDQINAAALVPVADEKAFLGLLEKLNFNVTRNNENDKTYKILTGKQGFDVYFRFAKGYAYLTSPSPESLADENLLDPAKVLAPGSSDTLASLKLRLDRFPEGARFLAQTQIEIELQKAADKGPPDETPDQREFRVALLKELAKISTDILKEGSDLRLDLNVDQKARTLAVDFSLAGQADTELARSLQSLGKNQSQFAGLRKEKLALLTSADIALPENLNKAFIKVLEEGMNKTLGDIKDDQKRQQAKDLYQSLLPSLKSGRLDHVITIAGPVDKTYTFLGALKVTGGAQLERTLRKLVQEALAEMPAEQKARIQLDADAVGAVKIHRFEMPANNDNRVELFGNSPLYFAIRDDAAFIAIGGQALPTIKEAIAARSQGPAPLFLFNFDVARMSSILAKTAAQKQLAATVLTPGQDHTLRITAAGGDNLSIRLQITLSALEFLAKVKK